MQWYWELLLSLTGKRSRSSILGKIVKLYKQDDTLSRLKNMQYSLDSFAYSYDGVQDYLKYSAEVDKSDRPLCDRVAPLESYRSSPSLAKRDRDARSLGKMLQN